MFELVTIRLNNSVLSLFPYNFPLLTNYLHKMTASDRIIIKTVCIPWSGYLIIQARVAEDFFQQSAIGQNLPKVAIWEQSNLTASPIAQV